MDSLPRLVGFRGFLFLVRPLVSSTCRVRPFFCSVFRVEEALVFACFLVGVLLLLLTGTSFDLLEEALVFACFLVVVLLLLLTCTSLVLFLILKTTLFGLTGKVLRPSCPGFWQNFLLQQFFLCLVNFIKLIGPQHTQYFFILLFTHGPKPRFASYLLLTIKFFIFLSFSAVASVFKNLMTCNQNFPLEKSATG